MRSLPSLAALAILTVCATGCGSDPAAGADALDVAFGDVDDVPLPGDVPAESFQRDLPKADTPDVACGANATNYFPKLRDALQAFSVRCLPGDVHNLWQRPEDLAWKLSGTTKGIEAIYVQRFVDGALRVDEAQACTYLLALADGDCNATRALADGLVGDAAAGGPCGVDEECPEGHFCRFASVSACLGTCTAQVGDGQRCDPGGCLRGFDCRLDAADEYRCVASKWIRTEGQACDAATDFCAHGYCAGTCKALPGVGEPCSPDQYCQGSLCDRTMDRCVPWKGQGQKCASWYECEDGLYCLPFTEGETCQPRLGLGGTCDPARKSFDFGISLACASGLCGTSGTCVDEAAAPACN